MKEFFGRFSTLIYKELLQFIRSKGLLIFAIYAFTLDIYFAATGISLTLRNAKFFVQDYDMTPISREYVYKFHKPYFNFQGYVLNDKLLEDKLLEDKAIAVIKIPDNFERDFKKGRAEIGMIINGAEIVASYLFSAYAAQITYNFIMEHFPFKSGVGLIEPDARLYFNQNASSKNFMGISELLTVVTLFLLILPSAAIIREKERGNIEMLVVSPVHNYTFMLAKVVAMSVVILLCTMFSMIFMVKGVLGIPVKGNLLDFAVFTLVFVFAASGLSMFIAAISENMLQVSQLSVLVLVPILYLSGSWTPIEAMPKVLQYLSYLSPLKYYIDGAFGILIKGLSLSAILPDLAGLLILGSIVFFAGSYFLSKKV
ncbi:ABC transporter permease [Desulfurobacterium indicum]|uniref:Multidrug ABC transporter permease n=1 Tax=Desulfurobacterium indicum TaxID=1914305 RepID=A0A1R1MN36_9BACT|nr:ABC transporter permease [Desulfurobacterium indicum]OMH41173.1 multidrug ABC transporter permease [Desulfurobacterium indicum]